MYIAIKNIIIWLMVLRSACAHKRYRNTQNLIRFDHLGNCYVDSLQIRGRCMEYQNCWSAVQRWQLYRVAPYSCYATANNYICCPEAFAGTVGQIAPTTNFVPYPMQLTNQASTAERKSEKECAAIYETNHFHRYKRNTNNSENQTIEDVIEKEKYTKTEAVGGVATFRDEFPFMCALGWRKKHASSVDYNCGCVLIAPKYALTAAHCANLGGESPSLVRLGGVALNERHGGETIKIRRITQHPEYNAQYAYNDIAIIKFEQRSRNKPACLWPHQGLPLQTLTALGYGQTKFAGPSSSNLLKVFLSVLTNENCNKYYAPEDKLKYGIDAGQICAGDAEGKMDTCQGDSGGPLFMNTAKYGRYVPYIVGLTSFGEGCAMGSPSVYTRIFYFIDWIESVVWKK